MIKYCRPSLDGKFIYIDRYQRCSTFAAKIKNYVLMLVYKLLKIAPDGGEFANTTLGLLFGLMEAGLAIWFLVELISNTCF